MASSQELAEGLERAAAAGLAAPKIITWATEGPKECAFQAYYDGREEGDHGYGPTAEAAEQDLIDNYDAPTGD